MTETATDSRYATPPALHPGDRIRIVAPSSPFGRERFDTGVDIIRGLGFEPDWDDGLFTNDGYLAGSDARRAQELRAALVDPTVRALWFARGGYGATRLLPLLDSAEVRAHPKWLVGFSDATALHALWQRAGLSSLHGGTVTSLNDWSDTATDALRQMLSGEHVAPLVGTTAVGTQAVSGPLIGGNMAVLCAMIGTGFLPSLAGAVVLLEDVNEPPYWLDRLLTQLTQSGAFDGVVGFAVGQLTSCGDEPEAALDTVCGNLRCLDVPIVAGLPLGHEPCSQAVVLGATVTLDPAARTVSR